MFEREVQNGLSQTELKRELVRLLWDEKQISSLNPRTIAAKGERWVDQWTKVVIQGLEPSALR
jgi:hypothetical protein